MDKGENEKIQGMMRKRCNIILEFSRMMMIIIIIIAVSRILSKVCSLFFFANEELTLQSDLVGRG